MIQIDKSLINKCLEHDRKAQFELYKKCYAFMMGVCLRYVRNNDDAKALVNQAFLKVCDNLDKYEFAGPFSLWVRRITINTVIDDFRRNKKHRENLDDSEYAIDGYGQSFKIQNEGAQNLDAEELRVMIRSLPETTQKIFNLCVLDGYEYGEAAEMLSMSEGTCRWHVHNARKVLKEMIEKASLNHKSMVS